KADHRDTAHETGHPSSTRCCALRARPEFGTTDLIRRSDAFSHLLRVGPSNVDQILSFQVGYWIDYLDPCHAPSTRLQFVWRREGFLYHLKDLLWVLIDVVFPNSYRRPTGCC